MIFNRFFYTKKSVVRQRIAPFLSGIQMPIFGYISRESYFVNILFWHPATLYLFSLSIFSTAVCVFASPPPPTSLPVPFATTSHLLDLIEFFPEEEMFPPNESVEILHSDKHDPIFRLIKESLSLFPPCLRRTFSQLPTAPSSLSLFSFHDLRLYLKCFPIKHARYSCTCRSYQGLVSVRKLWDPFNFYEQLVNLINLEIMPYLLNIHLLQLKSCNLLYRILTLNANVLS